MCYDSRFMTETTLALLLLYMAFQTLYPRMPYRNTCAHLRCLSLQSATMTSRFPNTVMMIMMERKMVRTIVSSELRNSCCCCWSCCCSVFITSSNKLQKKIKLFSWYFLNSSYIKLFKVDDSIVTSYFAAEHEQGFCTNNPSGIIVDIFFHTLESHIYLA